MELSELLTMLPPVSHPNLLVNVSTFDDAGVYKLTDDTALVQTVDVFTPVVDDPYAYGQIAAANSLSDVYAMGGKPLTALNIVGFPKRYLGIEVLAEILKGALDKTQEADCVILGGHTIVDDELKFGLAVTGIIHPERIITNANAKRGDRLILTKPLGIGILTTALKRGTLGAEVIEKITTIMVALNKTAAELMVRFDAHSATDITGFGLLGHSFEMAEASGVSFILYANLIPYLPETLEKLKEGGNVPGGTYENKFFVEPHVTFDEAITEDERMILFDAQTSGGLFISVSKDSADELLLALQEVGITDAEIIGEVVPETSERIKVLR
jgi:selenide,water dikinase